MNDAPVPQPPASPAGPAAGWYPDADVELQMRWWDGQAWTNDTYQRTEPMPLVGISTAANTGINESTAQLTATLPADAQLGSWGRRCAARILDWLLSVIVAGTVGWQQWAQVTQGMGRLWRQAEQASAAGKQFQPLTVDDRLTAALSTLAFLWLFVVLMVDLIFLPWWGGTPGKLLLGLRVRSAQGKRLSVGQVVRRWLAFQVIAQVSFFGLVYSLFDALWPLRDARRQCLHDKFARTIVVRPNMPPATGTAAEPTVPSEDPPASG
jgi:hypothetical protein